VSCILVCPHGSDPRTLLETATDYGNCMKHKLVSLILCIMTDRELSGT
jgi:hypothetical protein